jgi:hypothetical protein
VATVQVDWAVHIGAGLLVEERECFALHFCLLLLMMSWPLSNFERVGDNAARPWGCRIGRRKIRGQKENTNGVGIPGKLRHTTN